MIQYVCTVCGEKIAPKYQLWLDHARIRHAMTETKAILWVVGHIKKVTVISDRP